MKASQHFKGDFSSAKAVFTVKVIVKLETIFVLSG